MANTDGETITPSESEAEGIGGYRVCASAEEAVQRLCELYDASTWLAARVIDSAQWAEYENVRYPRLVIDVHSWRPIDRAQPFGYVDAAGRYCASVSRPRVMGRYFTEMIERLVSNYPCTIHVGYSREQIPPEYIDGLDRSEKLQEALQLGVRLPRPSLDFVDDGIIDAKWDVFHQQGNDERPLFHFSPQRFDIAIKRIEHYTGIPIEGVQNFILFSNYAMHTREFVAYALYELAREGSRYTELWLPDGTRVSREEAASISIEDLSLESHYQMPRYDLIAPNDDGLTMVNIGVGPSNAKTATDCLAVLRPEMWVMIGHCAGLDGRMRIGDLILGNAYERRDHILDDRIPLSTPIPAVPEVQRALERAVRDIYGEDKNMMRTGTVLSTDDRNWEWHTPTTLWEMFRGSTAVAVDMESSALATNGYRYRIPYGTLLSVSDLPLHAVPKLPSGAQAFYSSSKEAHVMCAVRAVESLAQDKSRLRTRKLRRTIGEVPFR